MSLKAAIPPMGRGNPPPNVVSYVSHPEGTYVKWQTNANGWAIGYEVVAISGWNARQEKEA